MAILVAFLKATLIALQHYRLFEEEGKKEEDENSDFQPFQVSILEQCKF